MKFQNDNKMIIKWTSNDNQMKIKYFCSFQHVAAKDFHKFIYSIILYQLLGSFGIGVYDGYI